MGSKFSKKAKTQPGTEEVPRDVDSAPGRMEGSQRRITAAGANAARPNSTGSATTAEDFGAVATIKASNAGRRTPPKHESLNPSPAPAVPAPHASTPQLKTTDPAPEYEPLQEAAIQIPDEAKGFVSVYGEHVVRGLYALMWGDREESLKAIQRKLADPAFLSNSDNVRLWHTTIEILCKALKDKVVPVYFSALETLKLMITELIEYMSKEDVSACITKLVPLVIHRVGNLNARIHTASTQTLMFLAADRRVGLQVIGPYVVVPIKKTRSQSNIYIGRLDLVQQMLKEFTSTQGLSVDAVMTFATPSLDSPDDKLRKAGLRVVCEVHRLQRMAGGSIEEKYFANLKPSVAKKLHAKLAEIDDGRESSTDIGRSGSRTGRQHLAPLEPLQNSQVFGRNPSMNKPRKTKKDLGSADVGSFKKLRSENNHLTLGPENSFGRKGLSRINTFDEQEEGLMSEILNV